MTKIHPGYLTIFVLSLWHQLGNCLSNYSNYTFTSMDGFSKTIPAVCWLTLNCPGAMDSAMDNNLTCIMGGSTSQCTLDVSGINSTTTFCNGSSRVTVDPNINVAIEEGNSTMDIISRETTTLLMCTPIVSCQSDENINWEGMMFNGSDLNIRSNETQLRVKARQYGKYTCSVTSDNMSVSITHSLYGGPRFDKSSENFRVTLNDRVEFPCNPSSEPNIANYSWSKDGNVLTEDGFQFIIEEAQYDDEGVYTCEVNNSYNTDSKSFHLKVRSPLTPLWPAIGIILELSLVAAIIVVHEWYKKYQEKKDTTNHDELRKQDVDDTEAYNFPSHSVNYSQHERRHRIDSITKESLLPDSVQ